MGFKHMLSFFVETFYDSQVITRFQKCETGSRRLCVCIDANFIVHQLLNVLPVPELEERQKTIKLVAKLFVKKCITELFEIYRSFEPKPKTVTLLIVLDGGAPDMKYECQKKRRKTQSQNANGQFIRSLFDSNDLLNILCDSIRLNLGIQKRILDSMVAFSQSTHEILFSDYTYHGEGENKISRYIINQDWSDDDTCIIVTLDSDAIILALFAGKERGAANVFVKLNYKPFNCPVFDIAELRNRISAKVDLNLFLIAAFLVGNDYIQTMFSMSTKKRYEIFLNAINYAAKSKASWDTHDGSTDTIVFIGRILKYLLLNNHIRTGATSSLIQTSTETLLLHLRYFCFKLQWNIAYFSNPNHTINFTPPSQEVTESQMRSLALYAIQIMPESSLVEQWNHAKQMISNASINQEPVFFKLCFGQSV